MKVYFPRLSSLRSAGSSQELLTGRRTGRGTSAQMYIPSWHRQRDYGPLGLDEGPLHLPYLSSHRTNSPASVSKDWLSTYRRVYFLGARTSAWVDPPHPRAPGGVLKGWLKEPYQAMWNSEVVGANAFHFKFQICICPSPSTVWFGSFFSDFSYIRLQCHILIMQQLSTACWFSGTDCFLMTV